MKEYGNILQQFTINFFSLSFFFFTMVDAILSPILEQLTSMAVEEAKEQVRLVKGVGKEVKKLTSSLRVIEAVLHDAEKRQVKEETVRLWLDQLRDACHDMEDVLGEWNTARLKLQIDGVDDHENDALVPKKLSLIHI